MQDRQPFQWQCKYFDSLEVHELYAIMQLRSEVFVVEQQCVYHDADGKDVYCHHLCAWQGEALVAYARIVPPKITFDECSIGRIVTASSVRRMGAGRQLMERSIEQCRLLFGNRPIRIGAQVYLQRFYESYGFAQASDEYDEDGIMHMQMIKPFVQP